jgi:photosystem II stability/assembly factor-like uncharacterized protein
MLQSIARCLAIVSAALLPLALPAQKISYPGSLTEDTVTWHGLHWREIGIFRGGRTVAVAGSEKRPYEYWMGTTGGGVYKTVDGGQTWLPVSDGFFGGTIGAFGISESNADIVYVGTGEYAIRGNVSHGDGVFKTTDGGRRWVYVGLAETQQIARVRVHPRNPDVAWVAAQGHVYGPNAERGIYKTTDGGKTWRKVLFRNDSTGAADLVLDPSNPDVMYASFWQVYRKPWTLNSGGAGSSIYKSTDGGEHWTELTRNRGLPTGPLGMIGLAVSAARPSLVFALIEADSGGLYRSDDAGATWKWINPDHRLRERAWYYMRIWADPKDTNVVYAANTSLLKSADGGKFFKRLPDPHGDNHDMWIAPNDPKRFIESSDGGATVTFSGGETWTDEDFATAQFYHVATTNHFPYHVCGAQQDNSGVCGPSRWPGGIPRGQWYDVSGESGYITARPDAPDITYGGDNSGSITRIDHTNNLGRPIDVWPEGPDGHPASEAKYRFQWTAPLFVSPHNSQVLYAAGNRLFKTIDEGLHWTPVSPDLTRNDPKTTGISGGLTSDQTTAEYYATIFAAAESPLVAGLIWAGSDDGLLHITRNSGATWTKVTPKDFGDFTRVSVIEPSHFAAGTAYVAANRYQLEDMAPYLWKTANYGRTWSRIDAGLPRTEFVRSVREDPVRKGLLFASTERGVWVSIDDGGHWQSLRLNLPIVPVHDLATKDGDLIAATHGRSFWILDDISPLRQWHTTTANADAQLFKPKAPYRVMWGAASGDKAHPVGQNPPDGALIYYWVKNASQHVTLDILDANHRLIRSFSSRQDSATGADSVRADSVSRVRSDSLTKVRNDSLVKIGQQPDTAKVPYHESPPSPEDLPWPQRVPSELRAPALPGLNLFAWNFQYPEAHAFPGMLDINNSGPTAPPGNYWVRLHVEAWTDSASFTIKPDPRVHATPAEYAAQFAFLRQVRDTVNAGTTAIIAIRNARAQLDNRVAGTHGADSTSLAPTARALRTALGAAEQKLYQVNLQADEDNLVYPPQIVEQVSIPMGYASSGDAKIPAQVRGVFDQFAPRLQRQLLELQDVWKNELARMNDALKKLGQPAIDPNATKILPPTPTVVP